MLAVANADRSVSVNADRSVSMFFKICLITHTSYRASRTSRFTRGQQTIWREDCWNTTVETRLPQKGTFHGF